MAKIALNAKFERFSCKFRPLKNIFRSLENGHSIRHQSIPHQVPAKETQILLVGDPSGEEGEGSLLVGWPGVKDLCAML